MKRIAVIGGGAAGLAAAITAARAGSFVTLFESSERVGDSIKRSGNGRCNFSNAWMDATVYHNVGFVRTAYEALPPEQVIGFLEGCGLVWREEDEGRLYPISNKSTSVLDALRYTASDDGVTVVCGIEVLKVTPAGGNFLIALSDGTSAFFDAVVVACGGTVAQPLLPSSYRFEEMEPLLGPLKTDTAPIRGLDGIRVRCSIRRVDERMTSRSSVDQSVPVEYGEVLFRDYGISGIAVFNMSRHVRPGDAIELDLMPGRTTGELVSLLEARFDDIRGRDAVGFFAGMLLPQVARVVLKNAGLPADAPLRRSVLPRFAEALQHLRLTVTGCDRRQCQIRRGGFAVEQFDPTTLESSIDRGLYVTGEALDVDGPCGGFNLHWAWASGMLAGRAAAGSSSPSFR